MVYTFYSYKGGVGRTLALANLAELFYQAGLRVLIIDWDLITPGLERYFPSLDLHAAIDHPGLIDMLLQYKKYMSTERDANVPFELEDPNRYLIPIYNDGFGPGSLHLLPAGRRPQGDITYMRAVTRFNWQDFYDAWEGELYFNWLREQFEKIADIILIDCRSGVSEMGSVCTYHWADVIVMFCASSQHDLYGTYEMVQKFTAERVGQIRASRPLKVMVVPSCIDEQATDEYLPKIKQEFVSRFSTQNFPLDSGLVTTGDDLWAFRIPQALNNLLTDKILLQVPQNKRHEGVYTAYCRIAEYLARLAPEASHIRESVKLNFLQHYPQVVRKNDLIAIDNSTSQHQLKPGLTIITDCEVNLRPTPGYIGKPRGETISIAQGTPVSVLGGPCRVDGLSWWQIKCNIGLHKPKDYTQWKQKNFSRGFTDHSADPSKAILERSADGSLVVLGWVAEKTPSGISQLREVSGEAVMPERLLLPNSPSFEMPDEQVVKTMQVANLQQEEQRETVSVTR
ncbi:MAG: KGGVGR-motif variant AAA ATPase [Caldilineaceae bacterium]